MSAETIDGEIIDERDDHLPALREDTTPTLFGTTDPEAVVVAATRAAAPLAKVVRDQKLSVKIGPSEHVRVEGWTLLGSMLGVFPICVWTRRIDGDQTGWEARVEARTRDGALVGAAEAECLRSEKTWANRDDYALRSMAQTRATSKALRQPLGFVMQLAGFNPTPAEEMPAPARRQPARNKVEKMRDRIRELAAEADTKRGEAKTLAEIAAALAEMGTTLDEASEEKLAIVGSDLTSWVKSGCGDDFKVLPF